MGGDRLPGAQQPGGGRQWEEYLLFNPYAGFRFLVPEDEQWTLYAMLRQDVSVTDGGAELPDGLYVAVSSGRARTDYVMGEFYWRVRVGDEVDLEEFAERPVPAVARG